MSTHPPVEDDSDYLRLQVLIEQRLQQHDLWERCGHREASFTAGPLLWLTSHTFTEDDHWLTKGTEPIAPFPKHEYFIPLIQYMLTTPRLFIIKSREMMTSWLTCGYVAWMTQWLPHVFWVIQTEKEDKVAELIRYCRILYRRQPDWMKEHNPLVVDNDVELVRKNGSRILGVPKGENQIRIHHPYGYLVDEAAFLPEAEQCYNAVAPVAKQIIAVSTDNVGWFHNETKL